MTFCFIVYTFCKIVYWRDMENQRIRLTKKLLKDALIKLLHQKSVDSISVTELCRCAEINRVTFYKYYSNPSDVLTEIKDEMLSGIEEIVSTYERNSTHLISALQFFQEKDDELIVLMKNLPSNELEERLFYSPNIKKILSENYLNDYAGADKEWAYLFICNGAYSIIRKWMIEGCQESPESIADFIHGFAIKLLD